MEIGLPCHRHLAEQAKLNWCRRPIDSLNCDYRWVLAIAIQFWLSYREIDCYYSFSVLLEIVVLGEVVPIPDRIAHYSILIILFLVKITGL